MQYDHLLTRVSWRKENYAERLLPHAVTAFERFAWGSHNQTPFSQPQVRDTPEPFVSRVRAALSERTRELERLAVELYARGLSTRDIEDAFTDETGRRLLSRAAVSEVTERL